MNPEEIRKVLVAHKKWLEDEEGGERADLSGADLSDADLSGANLRRADLRYADLSDADLSSADLSDADLRDANLRRANLRRANMRRANMRRANLRRANLRGADLSGADLDFASLPLWCGSLKMLIDERIEKQVLYHLISIATDKTRYADLIDFANESHLVHVRNLPKLEAKDAETDDTETVLAKEAEAAEQHGGRSLCDASPESSAPRNTEG